MVSSHDAPGTESQQPKSWWQRRFSGWRGGVVLAITTTSVVLLLNIIITIVAATVGRPQGGFATVFHGSCTTSSRLFEGLQLIINLLSTSLLGASSYCMQRLVAPTREEIDAAHARRKWLDIGMPSIRNLASISWVRVVLWLLLCLSSLPLHFLYNSVIIQYEGAYDITFAVGDPAFFTSPNANWGLNHDQWISFQGMLSNGKYQDPSLWENITNDECISRYGAPFIRYGDGFGVPTPEYRSANGINESSALYTYYLGYGEVAVNYYPPLQRIPFSYCLSQILPQPCGLQFSLTIIYVVIACNVFKLAVMVIMLWKFDHETIVTIGDAVQSFIQAPDATTKNCCLESRHNIVKAWKKPLNSRRGQPFQQRSRELWFSAASLKLWAVPIILWAVTTGVAISIMRKNQVDCNNYVERKHRCILNGFGSVSTHYTLDLPSLRGQTSIIPYILVANTPQVFISFFYFTYNGLFTSMLANREWTQYSIKRASLRVSVPKPGQRSTYFLQLPYLYSVPLLLASLLFHWFVSQSIFLARVTTYYANNPDGKNFVSTDVGYSMYALVASLICGTVLIVACFLVAVIGRYPAEGMPMGGTNSAIISAACHVSSLNSEGANSAAKDDIVSRPLKWGVTREGSSNTAGHCSFSEEEVKALTVGFLYAMSE